jgi:IclR family acetate operon transcriptional repressor
MTPYTVTDPQKVRGILAQIRAQGWAVSFQQNLLGARGVAVPVVDHQEKVVASLGISGPHPRFSDQRARSFVPRLLRHGRTISKALGASLEEAEPLVNQQDPVKSVRGRILAD